MSIKLRGYMRPRDSASSEDLKGNDWLRFLWVSYSNRIGFMARAIEVNFNYIDNSYNVLYR